uniref:Ubiquitin-like protease family profile domain-containing protein n=1 Tax=Aegilops tauschii TaxID=37682 RepID=M8AT79_AEGTA
MSCRDVPPESAIGGGRTQCGGTPRASQFTAGTSTTPSARHVMENNEKAQLTPMKPVFGNDYKLTDEDIETAVYIRGTYDPVEIARIGDITLTAEKLKRNLDDKYIYGDVIMAYARISQIENDTTSIISPEETENLLQMKGVVPVGRAASWLARVAEKFVGRRKVHVPLNVHQNHWMLMMFNFDKKEIQTLNSMNYHCDKTKEDSLVDSIQFCIDEAVKNGLISPAKNINFAEWTKKRYENIPQQTDGTSCAVWTLQYMLSWNGDEMTDIFNQVVGLIDFDNLEEACVGRMFSQSTGLMVLTMSIASAEGMLDHAIYAATDHLATERAPNLAKETVLDLASNQMPQGVAALAVPAVHAVVHVVVILL